MPRGITEEELLELVDVLKEVKDPRVTGRCRHLLIDILIFSVCSILCGAETIVDIHEFARQKVGWLSKFLALPNGIPSHDTIARVLSLIDTHELEHLFSRWVQATLEGKLEMISIDGKSSKGTDRRFNGNSRPLHVVSAYSHTHGLSLCQAASPSSGLAEGEAALACLKMLDLRGVTVLFDAGLGQKKIVNHIRQKKGHYICPIKSNHKNCFAELEELFGAYEGKSATTVDRKHARHERRKCNMLSTQKLSERFKQKWPDAQTVFTITRNRKEKDKRYTIQSTGADGKQSYKLNKSKIKEKQTVTFYVSSKKLTPEQALHEVRTHWGIENKLHWILDVTFKEDNWMVRAKALARNLSSIRKMTFNILRSNKSDGSMRLKRKRAGWNDSFLEELVFGTKF